MLDSRLCYSLYLVLFDPISGGNSVDIKEHEMRTIRVAAAQTAVGPSYAPITRASAPLSPTRTPQPYEQIAAFIDGGMTAIL
ncbi:hypothetical protein ASD00_22655 [Ensifer sp. Root31]|nr:hypothetical protein ASD00_22655 [Ensifer sp. Root31]